MSKAHYKTKQMTEILTFLKSVEGQHVTVNDIRNHFKEQGISVGTTTVYRQLDKMVHEGTVAKYVVDEKTSACFEYVGGQEEEHHCYHCKCEKCGKLIHLHCHEVEELRQHMMAHHGFELNAMRTVFYGVCNDCRQEEAGNRE